MIIKITSEHIEEITTIANLMIETFPEAYSDLEDVILELKNLTLSPNLLLGYMENQKVVGVVGAILQYGTTGYELHPLIVHKSYRNQDIATKLIKRLEDMIIEQGGLMIYLGSDDESNLTSLSNVDLYKYTFDQIETITSKTHPYLFYQKMGYQVTGVIPDANGFGKPDIIMCKRLVHPPYETKDIIRRAYPIIEHDPEKEALINPELITNNYPKITKKLIITFFKDVIDKLIFEQKITHQFTLRGENTLDVYQYKDHDITIIEGKLGAPACAGFLEEMIALGAKQIIFCGGGGSLSKTLTVGKLVVVRDAIRDEGLSYHYEKPSRIIEANYKVYQKIIDVMNEKNIPHILGRVWTTDAFFRETKNIIDLRKKEGAMIVEMEQAAMIAVANYRHVSYGAILYAGDDLTNETWDSRGWRNREDIRYQLVDLCKSIILDLND